MTIMALLRLLQRLGLLNPNFRLFLLLLKMRLDFDASPDGDDVKDFIRGSAIGDWFVLYQMSKNLNQSLYFRFLVKLAQPLSEKKERTINSCKTEQKKEEKKKKGEEKEKRWSSFVSFATSPPPVLRCTIAFFAFDFPSFELLSCFEARCCFSCYHFFKGAIMGMARNQDGQPGGSILLLMMKRSR